MLTPQPAKAACIADEYLDIRNWAGDAPAAEQIGSLRLRLVGEFDTPDKPAVRQLARLYIRLGFGAEARALLRHMGGDLPDAEVLADLARLVDGDTPAPDRPIWIGDDCVGWHALWRAAAMSEIATRICCARHTGVRRGGHA